VGRLREAIFFGGGIGLELSSDSRRGVIIMLRKSALERLKGMLVYE
jgi:hypothetical protein